MNSLWFLILLSVAAVVWLASWKDIPAWIRLAITATAVWVVLVLGPEFHGLIPVLFLWGVGWSLCGLDRVKNYLKRKKRAIVVAPCPNESCGQLLRFTTTKGVDTKVVCPKCKTEFINIVRNST